MHLVKGCRVLGSPPLQQLLRVVQPVGSEGILGIGVLGQPWVGPPGAGTYKVRHLKLVVYMSVKVGVCEKACINDTIECSTNSWHWCGPTLCCLLSNPVALAGVSRYSSWRIINIIYCSICLLLAIVAQQ